jgi:2,3-bisphosphoglycerate-independent phosphoglycerate mutase
MVWKGGRDQLKFTPPHDLTYQSIENDLPQGDGAAELINLMTSSQLLFKQHPVNLRREQAGKLPANSIWLWGHGRAPHMETMEEKFGVTGAVISAVDLIKGIGVCAGLDVIDVPGATGYIDTNYVGKAEAALVALKAKDFVYLHVEAPDEAGHAGNLKDKIEAIEAFDEKVVGTIIDGLPAFGDYRVLVLPDHPTPVLKMTHTLDPVPYVLFGSTGEFPAVGQACGYSEKQAKATGVYLAQGHEMMKRFFR